MEIEHEQIEKQLKDIQTRLKEVGSCEDCLKEDNPKLHIEVKAL